MGGLYPPLFVEKNEFMHFVDECHLSERLHKSCSPEHFSQLFMVVNTNSVGGQSAVEPPSVNPKNMLNRREWIELLVRIAIMRYVHTGVDPDVSESLHRLLTDLGQRVPKMSLQDSNSFRFTLMCKRSARSAAVAKLWCSPRDADADSPHACADNEGVDAILRKHEVMLRSLFESFAFEEKPRISDEPNPFATPEGLSWDEWMEIVEALELVDRTFTRRDAGNVFVWSRMWALDDGTVAARRKVTNLFLEDFMEAIVRVALLKSLPTMEEIIYAGFSDCGEYLMMLKATGPTIELKEAAVSVAYDEFCQAHPVQWDEAPLQDAEDLVEHLLLLIKRTIEMRLSKSATADNTRTLTRREINRFRLQWKRQGQVERGR